MARWEPTHTITRGFGFGDPVKQYKKGSTARLSGDCLDFAALNQCALKIKPDVEPVEKKSFFAGGKASDV
jgi:hypothetical protein